MRQKINSVGFIQEYRPAVRQNLQKIYKKIVSPLSLYVPNVDTIKSELIKVKSENNELS